jgi:hypothetical protein
MISKSPDRFSFQKESYLSHCQINNTEPEQEHLELYQKMIDQHTNRWGDPHTRKNNLEYDLLTTDWILQKVRTSKSYAQNLYAAMCNNDFIKRDLWPILKEEKWGCSWRYAGGIIADMREQGDYIDWYCSGIQDVNQSNLNSDYVSEMTVTDEIEQDLFNLGWLVVKYSNEK